MDDIKYIKELESYLDNLDIDKKNTCLVGSACLAIRGLRENQDLDFAVSPKLRPRIISSSIPENLDLSIEKYGELGRTDVEIVENDTFHTWHEGFKIIRPEISLSFKASRQKEKDIADFKYYERIIEKSDDWNWALFNYNYTPSQNHPIGVQFANSVYKKGLFETIKLSGKEIASKTTGLDWKTENVRHIHNHIKSRLNIREKRHIIELFSKQFQGNRFNRHDIVSEWLNNVNSKNIDARNSEYEKEGTDKLPVVAITPNDEILDVEGFIRHLLNGTEYIPVMYKRKKNTKFEIDYTLEHTYVNNKNTHCAKHNLFKHIGVNFYLIAWSPVQDHFKSIVDRINCDLNVLDYHIINLDDKLYPFVDEMYIDHDKYWWIDYKKYKLNEYDSTVLVVEVENNGNTGLLPNVEKIKNLKDSIRKEYYAYVPDDQYHMILHGPDSLEEIHSMKKVMKKYTKCLDGNSFESKRSGYIHEDNNSN